MSGKELSPEDRIVRYVNPGGMHEWRVDSSEFQLNPRRTDDKGVSVNWLECYADFPKEARLAEIRRVIRLDLRRNGRFAELNVGEVKQHLAGKLPSLRIIHVPLDAEGELEEGPSHSEITKLPEPGSDQAEMIEEMIAICIPPLPNKLYAYSPFSQASLQKLLACLVEYRDFQSPSQINFTISIATVSFIFNFPRRKFRFRFSTDTVSAFE